MAVALVAFVVVSATLEAGFWGFLGSIALGCIMLWTFLDKDVHFIR